MPAPEGPQEAIQIERANAGDVPAIKSVLAVTWRDAYAAFLPESAISRVIAEWHTPEVLADEIARATTYAGVARSPSAGVVGMITAHSRDELLVIARLYVLPAFQRRGLGERLVQASHSAFPDAQRVRLHVEEQNSAGRAFYRRLGFMDVGEVTEDVAGTELRLIAMEKVL